MFCLQDPSSLRYPRKKRITSFGMACILLLAFDAAPFFYPDSIAISNKIILFDSLITYHTLPAPCNTSLAECIKKSDSSSLAARLYNFAGWLIFKDNGVAKAKEQIDKRISFFFSEKTYTFLPNPLPLAGDTASPVKIITYISSSCPLCKKVTIPLHFAVSTPALKGKASLEIRPMTPNPGDRGLIAAQKQSKGWEYFLALEHEERRLEEKVVFNIAKKLGLNIERFRKDFASAETTQLLEQFAFESDRNEVTISPTLFINGRRYTSYKDPQWVIDAVEFEIEHRGLIKK